MTTALLLGMVISALEATAVSTAMPTAIAELGGVARYSWVFSAYLLTSTTTVPLYGKLADLYGRRRIYLIAVGLFLLGSGLSGAAGSMEQLIAFRALQGLGAGGLTPIGNTIIGDIYTLEERGKMQGVFSGVWGLSSIVGPAAGGIITELLSWRWVFYINLPVGVAAALLLRSQLTEESARREHRLDVPGTVSLTISVTLLLVALLEGSQTWGWLSPLALGALALAAAGLLLFLWQERWAAEPMLPLDLFRSRLIAVSSGGSAVIGTLLLAASAYVPMFVQGVQGRSAVEAGMVLAPMSVGWPIASTLAGRLLLRTGYRRLVIVGAAVAVIGTLWLITASPTTSTTTLMAMMALTGFGLGCGATPYLVAVQTAVPWERRGVATSAIQFFRTIGGAIAVAVFGAVLNRALAPVLREGVNVDAALQPAQRALLAPGTRQALTAALDGGLDAIFVAFAGVAVIGLVIAWLFPRGSAREQAFQEPVERMVGE
ncbi:MAG: MFS transporter [Gemmatimonadetes bacterium]|nr:MFS transporter [Gemmatimonadota bacterium]